MEASKIDDEYLVYVGLLQRPLGINGEAVWFGSRRFPLQSISRVGWAGTRESFYGFPGQTQFRIVFGDAQLLVKVEGIDRSVFQTFIERLWHAVGLRLVYETLKAVKAGRQVELAGVTFSDEGPTLEKPNLLFGAKTADFKWHAVRATNSDGAFAISARDGSGNSASASYARAVNTPVLAWLVETVLEYKLDRLSALLDYLPRPSRKIGASGAGASTAANANRAESKVTPKPVARTLLEIALKFAIGGISAAACLVLAALTWRNHLAGRAYYPALGVIAPVLAAFAVTWMIRPPNKGVFIDRFGRRPLWLYGIWLWSSLILGVSAVILALISAGLLLWRSL
jgi:hypothetical protein